MSHGKLLGYVEVDSGTLLVGDPLYVLPNESSGKVGLDYQLVIDTPIEPAMAIGGQPVLLIQQFGGDGTFPVFGDFEDGELIRIRVDFVEPEEP